MTIVEQFNVLANLAKKVSVAELSVEMQDTIFKVQSQAMELQQQNYELLSNNTKLKDEITRLQKTEDIEKDLLPCKDGSLFNRRNKMVYCSTCWGNDKTLIQLVHHALVAGKGYCNRCKGAFANAMAYTKSEGNL